MAMHFMKYGGFYRAIDIDPGSELIAASFQDNKGVFRVSNAPNSGFNPFISYRGAGDLSFRPHLTQLMLEFLKANDSLADKVLTPAEQTELDTAIEDMLTGDLPEAQKTLSHLVAHLGEDLRRKFARWVRARNSSSGDHGGRYAHLFDSQIDAIGTLDTPIGVFNLQALRDDNKALRPALMETLYRITQSFEDPQYRHLPKQLDIDEAHYTLGIQECSEYIVSKIRTWGKFFGSINMWSQSAQEFKDIANWPAIRSAATTFWFMADPNMDMDLYQTTFGLSYGQCEAIRNLVPKREAFLWQPEIGVSKVVLFDVELEQAIMNTSHPRDAAVRDRLIKQHGFAKGMDLSVEHFKEQGFGDVDDKKLRAVV
jgi:type IV secretion system protein VirB4